MALALVGLSFVTSLITATFSLGGGTLMIAVLALVFPPAVVVPVHGCVQLGSNSGRALVQRDHIQWRLIAWISLGAVIGTIVGGQFVAYLPEHLFTIAIGAFVPLLATFIKGLADRRQLVATHAMLMTVLNTFKVLTFTALGFAFGAYLPLILVMVLAGFVGTSIGSRLLVKVPERIFRVGFKLVLTLVALDLIRGALF